jgi:hypothetical protein
VEGEKGVPSAGAAHHQEHQEHLTLVAGRLRRGRSGSLLRRSVKPSVPCVA